jgi:hypothetical protein
MSTPPNIEPQCFPSSASPKDRFAKLHLEELLAKLHEDDVI